MATYQSRIESITGITLSTSSIPTLSAVNQFLIDGVNDFTEKFLKTYPGESNPFIIESSECITATNTESQSLVTVVRESGKNNDWRVCRKAYPGMEAMLEDVSSFQYASKINPAYVQTGDSLTVYPAPTSGGGESFKYYYINTLPTDDSDATLNYASTSIKNFPEHKDRYIVAYAAAKVIESKMANYTIEEEDPELMQSIASNLQLLKAEYMSAFASNQGGGRQDEG